MEQGIMVAVTIRHFPDTEFLLGWQVYDNQIAYWWEGFIDLHIVTEFLQTNLSVYDCQLSPFSLFYEEVEIARSVKKVNVINDNNNDTICSFIC